MHTLCESEVVSQSRKRQLIHIKMWKYSVMMCVCWRDDMSDNETKKLGIFGVDHMEAIGCNSLVDA